MNIAIIAKAGNHKLPGKSSLNVRFVCPVSPVCPACPDYSVCPGCPFCSVCPVCPVYPVNPVWIRNFVFIFSVLIRSDYIVTMKPCSCLCRNIVIGDTHKNVDSAFDAKKKNKNVDRCLISSQRLHWSQLLDLYLFCTESPPLDTATRQNVSNSFEDDSTSDVIWLGPPHVRLTSVGKTKQTKHNCN